jgi:HD-like signal output (HDOD) protein
MTEIDLIVNQFILERGKLYTLPELYHQLEEKMNSNTASIDEIGEIISTDATLCARILKIANSSLYGFRAEVSTLNRALNLIGVKEVKNLILLNTLSGNFNDNNQCTAVNMQDFWRRSVYLALISKRLSKRLKHPDADRLFISAIMSRLGQLVCCSMRSEDVVQVQAEHLSNPKKIEFDIEQSILGFTYNEVSAKILDHWKVPEEIIVGLQYLHKPQNIPEDKKNAYLSDLLILNVATIYSGILEQDDLSPNSDPTIMQSTESYLTKVSPDINKLLTIDETMIEDILFEIEIDALEFLGIIFPNSSLIY